MIRIAAFDLDKTLTDRDCLVRFFWYLYRRGEHLSYRHAFSKAGLSRNSVKMGLCGLLHGQSVDHIEKCASDFFNQRAQFWLRSATVNDLREHQLRGDRIVIISASLSLYVKQFASGLGADYLATDLASVGGILTGNLDGKNVRGEEKVSRLRHWLAAQNLERTDVHLTAYGDSSGDKQLLNWADQSVWVK